MRLTESAAPDGPLETVVPSCLHGRVSSPHRKETPIEGSLDRGLSIGAKWRSLLMLGSGMFIVRMCDVGGGQSEMNRKLYVHV